MLVTDGAEFGAGIHAEVHGRGRVLCDCDHALGEVDARHQGTALAESIRQIPGAASSVEHLEPADVARERPQNRIGVQPAVGISFIAHLNPPVFGHAVPEVSGLFDLSVHHRESSPEEFTHTIGMDFFFPRTHTRDIEIHYVAGPRTRSGTTGPHVSHKSSTGYDMAIRPRTPRGAVSVLAIALLALHQDASSAQTAPLRVRIQALIVSDDDGGRTARVTPQQISQWVDFANRTFEAAGIRFDFSPTKGVAPLNSTVINSVTGSSDTNWREARRLGNEIAARFPDATVVFFRYGPGDRPTGAAFSWTDYNFVVMPGFTDAQHCGHAHVDALAHEIGHYLGLPHTFAATPFKSAAAAETYLRARGGTPEVFDGDSFGDTPPDPSIRSLECDRRREITLGGIAFRLPRQNIMSYYDERVHLSPLQIRRVRWVLDARVAGEMALPRNTAARDPIEAESLEVLAEEGAGTSVQRMSGFGVEQWSGEAQLFVGARENGSVTLALPVRRTGRYRLILYATAAPDFGMIKVAIDGQTLGDTIDLYAPMVLPSGAIPLGSERLEEGTHRLTFTSVGKNDASLGFRFGIDSIELLR